MSAQPVVVIHRQDDGQWRWRWLSGTADGPTLTSAHGLESLEEAESGARSAYPDTPVLVQVPPAEGPPRSERAGRLVERMLTAVLFWVWVLARVRARRRRD